MQAENQQCWRWWYDDCKNGASSLLASDMKECSLRRIRGSSSVVTDGIKAKIEGAFMKTSGMIAPIFINTCAWNYTKVGTYKNSYFINLWNQSCIFVFQTSIALSFSVTNWELPEDSSRWITFARLPAKIMHFLNWLSWFISSYYRKPWQYPCQIMKFDLVFFAFE